MELGDIDDAVTYNIAVVPPGAQSNIRGSVKTGGKYGFLAVNSIFLGLLKYPFEGMNEKGLTVSALEFRQGVYQQPKAGQQSVEFLDLVSFLLANSDSVNSSLAL